MGNKSAVFGNKLMNNLGQELRCLVRKSWIPHPEVVETGNKNENLPITPVPILYRGRYYSYSKPGGPLSQDTHTSSGLSIYGLGVCA